MAWAAGVLFLALAGSGGLGGCGSTVPARRASLTPGGQGASWDVVLPSLAVSEADRIAPGDPVYERRDAALALREPEAIDGIDASFPALERPSLAYSRRLILPANADTVIYMRGHPYRRFHSPDLHHRAWRSGY